MNKMLIGFLILTVVFSLAAGGVQARATQTPYQFTVTDVEVGVPERVWVDGGILHIREQPVKTSITGDIVGSAVTIRNVNLDLSTGDGSAWGTFVRSVTWQGLSGTFEGHFTAKITGSSTVVQLVGHGTEDFEGMQIRDVLTLVAPDVFEGEGIILNSNG